MASSTQSRKSELFTWQIVAAVMKCSCAEESLHGEPGDGAGRAGALSGYVGGAWAPTECHQGLNTDSTSPPLVVSAQLCSHSNDETPAACCVPPARLDGAGSQTEAFR